jgi:TPR repeat protein
MTTAARSWLHTILLTVLVFLTSSASAEMTPAELKAFSGYKAKAEKGDPVAQFNLGFCFDTGLGVAKNQVEAVKWYRKAAGQGNAAAQCNLGYCYDNGEGVAKDQIEAV